MFLETNLRVKWTICSILENQKFEIGKAVSIGEGTDATIFATGVTVAEALKAKEELEKIQNILAKA